MKVDLLIKEVVVKENGSERKSCPALVVTRWMPNDQVNQGGRKINGLRDNTPIRYTTYQEQLELRAEVTGKSWIEVNIISMQNYGLLGKLAQEIFNLLKPNWPLPIGSQLIDGLSEDLRKGSPQVIAAGQSAILKPDDMFQTIQIDLKAPSDVLGDYSVPLDPVTGLPTEEPPRRSILLSKDSPNGHIIIEIVDSNA